MSDLPVFPTEQGPSPGEPQAATTTGSEAPSRSVRDMSHVPRESWEGDYGMNFPNSRKVFLDGSGGIRVPVREIHLAGDEPPAPPDFSKGYVWKLHPEFDIVVLHEGEQTLLELLQTDLTSATINHRINATIRGCRNVLKY